MTLLDWVVAQGSWALWRAWAAMDENMFDAVQWLITLSTPLFFIISTLVRTRCCRRTGTAAVAAAANPSFWSFLWGPVGMSLLLFLTMTYVVTPFYHEWETAHRDVAKAVHDLGANCRTDPRQPFMAADCDKTLAIAGSRPFWLAWEKRSNAMANWLIGFACVALVLVLFFVGQKTRPWDRLMDARNLKQHQQLLQGGGGGKSFL